MKKIFSLAVVLTMGMTTASTAFAQEEENIMYWQCTTDSARWVDKGTLSATLWDNYILMLIRQHAIRLFPKHPSAVASMNAAGRQ